MSEYHKDCANPDGEKKKPRKQSKKSLPPLTTKPFCDCENCECKDCPDILKMLSITVTDTTCVFDPKPRKSYDMPKCETSLLSQRQSLLDALNPERDCDCEVVARAIRSNIHMNLGLPQVRDNVDENRSQASGQSDSAQ